MEISLDVLPDQNAVPYVEVINEQYECESCNQSLVFEESFRITSDCYVCFYREPYYTCECDQFIWVVFRQHNSGYISSPAKNVELLNPNLHPEAYVIKAPPEEEIKFIKEELKSIGAQPIEKYNLLYESIITLSMQVQLAYILQPEQMFRVDFNETEKTGLRDLISNIIRYSGNLFWWDTKRLLMLDSIRLICSLLDTGTKDNFNLTVLMKRNPQATLLKCLYDELKKPQGKYHKIQKFRHKMLAHIDSRYVVEQGINEELLSECLSDLIESVNELNQIMGLTFALGHVQPYSRTESFDSLLSVLEKIDSAMYNDNSA